TLETCNSLRATGPVPARMMQPSWVSSATGNRLSQTTNNGETSMRRRSMNRSTVLVIASLTTIVLSGCGKDLPTAPSMMNDPGVSKAPVRPSSATSTSSYTWNQLASEWVNKGEAATVSGGRYKVQLVRGGLGQGATIVISERDPMVPDAVIGPSG